VDKPINQRKENLVTTFRHVCVYCGSSSGNHPEYQAAATELGQLLAQRQITLVYGGGNIGLMKTVADGVLEAGGNVIGVIPRKLMDLELAHPHIQEIYVTESMHQRKYMMAQLADAFVAMPGGWGTLEELSEITTWAQLNYHHKAIGLLNTRGYYDALLGFLKHANQEGFIRAPHLDLMAINSNPKALLQQMTQLRFPDLAKTLGLPIDPA